MIELDNLTKHFGALRAIEDVSFTVEPGEIAGFLGPNGAGKTTTLRILTGFLTPDRGRVRLGGIDPARDPIGARRKLGYLPEQSPLYTDMFVDEYLTFVARAKGVGDRRAAVDEVAADCRLGEVQRRRIGKLSKGYRQRVGLAQALLGRPEILILDEPTNGLDPTQIVEMRNLIRSLAERMTVLLSSHILPEVSQTCSKVVIISEGRVVAAGTPQELTSQGEGAMELSLRVSGSQTTMREILSRFDGLADWSLTGEEGPVSRFGLITESGRDIRPDLVREIVAAQLDLLELKAVRLSLEDVFVKLVTHEEGEHV